LKEFFTLNFSMWHHHNVPLNTFDDMLPWERDLYINMKAQKVEEENEKLKLEEAQRRATKRSRRR
jgi:hypothetical protein